MDQINYFQAFVIGISQAVAMWPGFSRSGSTISTGVLMKLNHKAASDFTFIMAVPIMLAASGLSLLKHYQDIQIADIPFLYFRLFSCIYCWTNCNQNILASN